MKRILFIAATAAVLVACCTGCTKQQHPVTKPAWFTNPTYFEEKNGMYAEMPVFPTKDTNTAPVTSGNFLEHDKTYNPFRQSRQAADSHWQTLYQPLKDSSPQTSGTSPETLFEDIEQETAPVQIMDRYILLPSGDGLMLINQHRAHALLLYDACMRRLTDHGGESQQLLDGRAGARM